MVVSPAGYAHMTALLSTLAGGRLVVALEGGYNLRAISHAAAAVHATLLGDPLPLLERRAPVRAASRPAHVSLDPPPSSSRPTDLIMGARPDLLGSRL